MSFFLHSTPPFIFPSISIIINYIPRVSASSPFVLPVDWFIYNHGFKCAYNHGFKCACNHDFILITSTLFYLLQ